MSGRVAPGRLWVSATSPQPSHTREESIFAGEHLSPWFSGMQGALWSGFEQ